MAEPRDEKTDISAKTGHVITDSDLARQPTDSTPNKSIGNEESLSDAHVYIDDEGLEHYTVPVETAAGLITEVIHVEDDPTLNPWTFRTWFIGAGLATFGGILATIYQFKPQTVLVSPVFLAVVSYVLGEFMAIALPRKGVLGRWLNPHDFNSKEHAAIVVMSAASANAPVAVNLLAAERLYYNKNTGAAIGIFLILASQFLGYGVAGLLRRTLVYPTKMLYPVNLPMNSLLEALHGDKILAKKQIKLFYVVFVVLFFYEIIPEYIMPILVGVSIFCLANKNSLVWTNFFGGSNGNEGMGIFAMSFDWQYISIPSPLWYPLQTLFNSFVGYVLCICVFAGVYYGNIWNSQSFPFLSQAIFSQDSNNTSYLQYNQTQALDQDTWEVDWDAVQTLGFPYFTGTFAVYLLASNLSITSTFTHLLLWNYDDLKDAWAFMTPRVIARSINPANWNWRFWKTDDSQWGGENDKEMDPHYRLLLVHQDSPNWWYFVVLLLSVTIGLITTYTANSTLPWWQFLVSCVIAAICILFFGAQYAITGYNFNIQSVIQIIGGYLRPGSPMANMYFVMFGYNSVVQSQLLLKDLKFAQYAHLSPRCTFTMQMVGTVIGSIFSYIILDMVTINQHDTLLGLNGSATWSGQATQQYNSQAVAYGGFSSKLFSVGGQYQWVTMALLVGFLLPLPFWIGHKFWPALRLDYFNTAIISSFIGLLNVGVNSVTMPWFIIGAWAQLYMRKYHPNWFIKYNYILSAALDGGTQVMVFILSFAVFGTAGDIHQFPGYWGNNNNDPNKFYDYCMKDPGAIASGN